MKEAESRLHLYKYYIPLIVNAISESIKVDPKRLSEAFTSIAERHVRGEATFNPVTNKEDRITGERIDQEVRKTSEVEDKEDLKKVFQDNPYEGVKKRTKSEREAQKIEKKNKVLGKEQTTLDALNVQKKMRRK
jgi:DNA topoisomerase-6 subunit B